MQMSEDLEEFLVEIGAASSLYKEGTYYLGGRVLQAIGPNELQISIDYSEETDSQDEVSDWGDQPFLDPTYEED
jgi:hypothetical protein